jgi:hypothetical protein
MTTRTSLSTVSVPAPVASTVASSDLRHAIDSVDLVAFVQRDGISLRRIGQLYQGLCPFHDESTPSFTVYRDGAKGWYCFGCQRGGSPLDYVLDRLHRPRHDKDAIREGLAILGIGDRPTSTGLPPAPPRVAAPPRPPDSPPRGEPTATYDYCAPDGTLHYRVARYLLPDGKKTFRQQRPDGHGGWLSNRDGVAPLLYRLPDLLAADPSTPVFICEGEKDVETLRAQGHLATCNSGGAGQWPPDAGLWLRNRHVIILPDNDDPGHRHADLVAENLRPVAASIRVLDLATAWPELPPKGDVSDFLAVHPASVLPLLARLAPAIPCVDPTTGEILGDTSPITADLIATIQHLSTELTAARAEAQQHRQRADQLCAMIKLPNILAGVRIAAPHVLWQYLQRQSAGEVTSDGWGLISMHALAESSTAAALPPKQLATKADLMGDYVRDMAALNWFERRAESACINGQWITQVWIRPTEAFLTNPAALPVPPSKQARPKTKPTCPKCHSRRTRELILCECLACNHVFPKPADPTAPTTSTDSDLAQLAIGPATPIREIPDRADAVPANAPIREIPDRADAVSANAPIREIPDRADAVSANAPIREIPEYTYAPYSGISRIETLVESSESGSAGVPTPALGVQEMLVAQYAFTPLEAVAAALWVAGGGMILDCDCCGAVVGVTPDPAAPLERWPCGCWHGDSDAATPVEIAGVILQWPETPVRRL